MKTGFTLWFTGMSGAGKSTIATTIAPRLKASGKQVEILDGDEVRTNLSKGLGFSREDRETVEESVNKILARLQELGFISYDGLGPIAPHGGQLVSCLVTGDRRDALLDKAKSLPRVQLDERAQSDVEMIAVGAFSPLRGFLGAADYRAVVEHMRLTNGLPWSIPVTLPVSRAQADPLTEGTEVALVDERNTVLAILDLAERY